MSAALLKLGAVLSTMVLISNWMSQNLPALVGLDQHTAAPGTSEKIISVLYPGQDEGWQVYGSAQGRCVCSIKTPVPDACAGDPRHTRLQQISAHVLNVSEHMQLLTRRTAGDLQELRSSETILDTLEKTLTSAQQNPQELSDRSLQELRWSVSQCRPLRVLLTRVRADVAQLDSVRDELQGISVSLSLLQERFTLQHYQQLQQRISILQQHLHSCSSHLGCGQLISISAPLTVRSSGSRFGSWMMETSIESSDNRVWVMDGYLKGRRVLEYPSLQDFASGQNYIVHHLPHAWAGTGHVVFNGSLYYSKHQSSVLVRYGLASGSVLQQRELPDAGFNNTFPYSWGGASDIDLMVDGSGLWAVHSSAGRGGTLLLSRLHPLSLQVLRSWDTGFPKRSAGEAFLICGTLYITDSHLPGAKVAFRFHTHTHTYQYTDIAFHNQYSHISMLDYNPRTRALYTWNNGQQVLYQLTLMHYIHTHTPLTHTHTNDTHA
ncbi:noelin-2b precursor [Danio rerio]|uniref:Noelin-2b precursor n=4 Tax=Danio rerio TaxID=7955 RepID=A0A0R4ILX8_DANRE|nr:noelin-2b precursor [Danio rerio]|eukprot:NP_998425.2 olfactomedin 2 like precursor [Danio rerio]